MLYPCARLVIPRLVRPRAASSVTHCLARVCHLEVTANHALQGSPAYLLLQ